MQNSGKGIYARIAKAAGPYGKFLSLSGYEESVRTFVNRIPLASSDEIAVLDAGCGVGLYTLAVLARFPRARVTAFDLNSGQVEALQKKLVQNNLSGRVHLFTGNVEGALRELDGKRFDVVIAAGVLEYVDPRHAVKNLARFLRPGGWFLHSPVRNTLRGKAIARLYGCAPRSREENIAAFLENGLILEEEFQLPPRAPASFKELHLFRKT